jgi:hypothetical protein
MASYRDSFTSNQIPGDYLKLGDVYLFQNAFQLVFGMKIIQHYYLECLYVNYK